MDFLLFVVKRDTYRNSHGQLKDNRYDIECSSRGPLAAHAVNAKPAGFNQFNKVVRE